MEVHQQQVHAACALRYIRLGRCTMAWAGAGARRCALGEAMPQRQQLLTEPQPGRSSSR
jgi:hypothetical protein